MNSKQTVVHTKDTLYTLSAITGDPRYLTINETRKEKPAMCEVAEAIFQMGYNERNNEIAKMDTIIKEKEAALAEKDAQIAFLMEQLKLKSDF